jgi:hypothetical protein
MPPMRDNTSLLSLDVAMHAASSLEALRLASLTFSVVLENILLKEMLTVKNALIPKTI